MISILKIGGKVLDDAQQLQALLASFVQLPGPKILVHGGGKAATDLAARLGLPATMVEGRRVTDAAMLEVVTMVYGGLLNKQVVAALQALGCPALGLTGADLDLIRAHKRPVGTVDFGWVGDIDRVDADRLKWLLDGGFLPVLAPLTHDGQGHLLNTNADTIASNVAQAVASFAPVRLVFAFERPGVLRDPGNDASVIPLITPELYASLKAEGVISGGMIPKLDNAFEAIAMGVQEVVICLASALPTIDQPGFTGTRIRQE